MNNNQFSADSSSYAYQPHNLSSNIIQSIHALNKPNPKLKKDPFAQLGGGIAFHCNVDLEERRVIDTAAMATAFRGYETLLPGRDLSSVGHVSASASGICGGVHATASALCLEMAMGLQPPPLGIVLRNLLLCCQYLNDNTMHLFILAGPDYSEDTIAQTNPEIWQAARQSYAKNKIVHGYTKISDIMHELNKPQGALYLQALEMIKKARQAYALIGGKYPHSESIVPGGVNVSVSVENIQHFLDCLEEFNTYVYHTIGIWEDVFNFMLEANPRYENVGIINASMVDFGQWDHEDYYNAQYTSCDTWGEKRWSTPGAIINGALCSTRLSEINCGIEEFIDNSFYKHKTQNDREHRYLNTDPLGNPISPYHPWNKNTIPYIDPNTKHHQAYSWGTSITWNRHRFEVGAYARLYISALAQLVPDNSYIHSTGKGVEIQLPYNTSSNHSLLSWSIPPVWNAFERNKARCYALAYNYAITLECAQRARRLLQQGESSSCSPVKSFANGKQLGIGMWGAGRGFLAHWAVINNGRIDNYQIAIPSRINASPRTPWGTLGPCEQAVLNTPIIETAYQNESDFSGIDIQRAIQSFDPCMSCTAHIAFNHSNITLQREIDTCFPI